MNCRITNVYFKKLIDCGSNKSQLHLSGGYDEKVTPVPIPNTAVKLLSADDTWLVTARESKSPPDLYQDPVFFDTGFCVMLGCLLTSVCDCFTLSAKVFT